MERGTEPRRAAGVLRARERTRFRGSVIALGRARLTARFTRGGTRFRQSGLVLVLAVLALWPTLASAQGADGPERSLDQVGGIESGGESVDGGADLRRERERPWRGNQASGEARGSFGKRYLKTLGWLVLVVALAVGSVFLLRRIVPGSIHPQNRNLVQVIGRGALGPKHQVVVTRIGERILILGLTPDSIVQLGEVDDPREAIRMTPSEETFADRITISEAAYREEDAVSGDLDDSSLAPYRREIDRLRGMVELWQGQDRTKVERGSA